MTKRFFYFSLLCILCALFFACSSAPEEPAPSPEPEVIEPVVQEPVSPPAPEPTPAPVPTPEPVPVVAPDFTEENSALIEQIYQTRESAIQLGAKDFFPDEFLIADAYASSIEAQYESEKSTESFKNKAEYVLKAYQSFENLAKTYSASNKIDQIGGEYLVIDEYNKAIDLLNEIEAEVNQAESVDSLNIDTILAKSNECANIADNALTSTYKTFIASLKYAFENVKQQAEEIKAQVSAKADFEKSVNHQTNAENAFASSDFETSYNEYSNATNLMTKVFDTVSIKRAEAQKAIDEAKKRAESAALFAQEADSIAPLADEETLEQGEAE